MDGVYTADPRIVPNARKLPEVSYDEMLEFASLGAKVLHNRSVEMAKRYGVQLVVLSSLTRAEGTVVKESTKMEKMLVSGVAADKNTARISVIGVADERESHSRCSTFWQDIISMWTLSSSPLAVTEGRTSPLPWREPIFRRQ